MANLILYHDNVLADVALVSGSEQETLSAAAFLADDRLSFQYTATGTHTLLKIDQQQSAIDPFEYLVLIDHNGTLNGATGVVRTYASEARTSATVVYSGSLAFEEPQITNLGSIQTGKQFIDVELTASGSDPISIGELLLASRFESPQYPAPGIQTHYLPRRSVVALSNGERQSVRHGGVARQKVYALTLRADEIGEWVDVFTENEGARLVVLTDEDGESYPALMNQTLAVNNDASLFTVSLEFTEIKL